MIKKSYQYTFWALFYPSEELPKQWIAHCLNLDIVTQGNSLKHAINMLLEAVQLILEDQRDICKYEMAPREDWKKLSKVISKGKLTDFTSQTIRTTSKQPTVAAILSVPTATKSQRIKTPFIGWVL
jgi:hypothetical protein